MTEPFLVHGPTSFKKLKRLIEHGARKGNPDFVPRYKAQCTGKKVELPPNVAIHKDERGYYFIAGPHERYYEMCAECLRSGTGIDDD